MHCTHLHRQIARVWMAPCGCKERDEGHYTCKNYEGTEKGTRWWRMGSRADRVNETEQLKAEDKKHPKTKVSGTNTEKIQRLSMPRGTKPWSSNTMLHLQCKQKDLSGNVN